MFTLVNALLLRPLTGKADELVGLYSHDRTKPTSSYRGFPYANILAMMLKEGAALTAVGVALGLALAALLGFGVSRMLYDVKPLDPVVFVAAPVLLALAALVATSAPTRGQVCVWH